LRRALVNQSYRAISVPEQARDLFHAIVQTSGQVDGRRRECRRVRSTAASCRSWRWWNGTRKVAVTVAPYYKTKGAGRSSPHRRRIVKSEMDKAEKLIKAASIKPD